MFCEKQKDASEFDRYVLLKHTVELEDGQESLVFVPKDKTATEYQFLKPVLKELLHDSLRQARQPTLLVLSRTRRFRAAQSPRTWIASRPSSDEALRDQDHGRPVPAHGPSDQDCDACVGQKVGRI